MVLDRRALLLGMIGIPLQPVASQQPSPKPDLDTLRRELETALRSLVRVEIARAGAQQSPDSAKLTEQMLTSGIDNLLRREQPLIESLSISLAVDGARRFGRELVRLAERKPDGNLRIGEGTFLQARQICPLYPIC